MTDTNKSETLMVRYLLGSATEEEQTEVEEAFFSDSAYFDQLLAVEDSLIDDYVSDRMSAEQRSAFEESFSPQRAEDVRFSRALIQAISKKKLNTPVTPRARVSRPAQQEAGPGTLEARAPRAFGIGLAVAALLFLVISVALFFSTRSLRDQLSHSEAQLTQLKEQNDAWQQQLSQEHAQRESKERELEIERTSRIEAESRLEEIKRDSARPRDFVEVTLGPSFVLRSGGGSIREIPVTENIRWLVFDIPVMAYRKYESYRISINVAGENVVEEKSGLKPSASERLRLRIGADVLKPNDYIMTLYGEKEGMPPKQLEHYRFRITS